MVERRIKATHQGISLTIGYDNQVYQPGPLTKVLSDVMEVLTGDLVIDVGCGTGYLGIVASLLGGYEVIAIDPMPEAIKWTRHNILLNGISNLKPVLGKALDPIKHKKADLILSLPPQMPYPVNFNPWRYGGPDGSDTIIKIIKQSRDILKGERARLFLVHSGLANPTKIRSALSEFGFQWKIIQTVEKKFDSLELNMLAPDLSDYLFVLAQRGVSEISERGGHYYYPVWFYRAVLGKSE